MSLRTFTSNTADKGGVCKVANLVSSLFGLSVQNAKDHERESRLDNAFILSISSSLRIFSIICYHIFGSYRGRSRDLAKLLLSDTPTTSFESRGRQG